MKSQNYTEAMQELFATVIQIQRLLRVVNALESFPIQSENELSGPKCPKCGLSNRMELNGSTSTWTCRACIISWDSNYLTGWNDGAKVKG